MCAIQTYKASVWIYKLVCLVELVLALHIPCRKRNTNLLYSINIRQRLMRHHLTFPKHTSCLSSNIFFVLAVCCCSSSSSEHIGRKLTQFSASVRQHLFIEQVEWSLRCYIWHIVAQMGRHCPLQDSIVGPIIPNLGKMYTYLTPW